MFFYPKYFDFKLFQNFQKLILYSKLRKRSRSLVFLNCNNFISRMLILILLIVSWLIFCGIIHIVFFCVVFFCNFFCDGNYEWTVVSLSSNIFMKIFTNVPPVTFADGYHNHDSQISKYNCFQSLLKFHSHKN